MVSKLKSKFGTGVELGPVRVPYRETIRKKVKVQGRHKKQSAATASSATSGLSSSPATPRI